MLHKKTAKSSSHVSRTVKKEMAEPRISRSAKIAEQNLDTTRNPENPSVTMVGVVEKIIPPQRTRRRETLQIAVDEGPAGCREFCIENILTDENGDDVKLKEGAEVEVTIAAKNISRKL